MFKAALWVALAPLLGYTAFLLLLTIPWVQNQALYLHNVHTSWWCDLDDPESFGFGKNQVTPFTVKTPDGESLHAWHILPRALYAKHEAEIVKEKLEIDNEFKDTLAYKLLSTDPESKLIINFHGNAGHLLQNQRPNVYRSYSSLDPHTHLIAFSYRGFGRSTGRPSETGLITDGVAVVRYALDALGLPPRSIALVGQSLGTAVLSGTIEQLLPSAAPSFVAQDLPTADEDFALILLICGFTDLKTLLLEYRMGGAIPILAPLAAVPGLQKVLQSVVAETWESQVRLRRVVFAACRDLRAGKPRKLNIQFVHAHDDRDIPYTQSIANHQTVVAEVEKWPIPGEKGVVDNGGIDAGDARLYVSWGDSLKLGLRILPLGGHNRIPTDTAVAVTIMQGLGLVDKSLP